MSRFRLAAFDLDGTLVDSAPDLARCLGSALAEIGLDRPDLATTRTWIGDGIEALIERGLAAALGSFPTADLIQGTLQAFDRCYREQLFTNSLLYPGVIETLAALQESGLILGCVTNKREAYAIRLLELAGLTPYLTFIYGGDTFQARKPDPEPLRRACEAQNVKPDAAVMIGDSANDLAAAKAAGIQFIFARYGYAAADDAELRAGFAAIDAVSELCELLCAA